MIVLTESETNVHVFEGSVFSVVQTNYDVVLALRIFHHFLKTKERYEELKIFLGRLDAREMYFQPHDKAVQDMAGAYRNFNLQEFIDFILRHSKFSQYQIIGETAGGKIFRFGRR